MGIHNGSKIVVMILKEFIRAKGVVAFKVMGHEKVWVRWRLARIKEGYATEKRAGTIV
jgi:hypothetical protein